MVEIRNFIATCIFDIFYSVYSTTHACISQPNVKSLLIYLNVNQNKTVFILLLYITHKCEGENPNDNIQ